MIERISTKFKMKKYNSSLSRCRIVYAQRMELIKTVVNEFNKTAICLTNGPLPCKSHMTKHEGSIKYSDNGEIQTRNYALI